MFFSWNCERITGTLFVLCSIITTFWSDLIRWCGLKRPLDMRWKSICNSFVCYYLFIYLYVSVCDACNALKSEKKNISN